MCGIIGYTGSADALPKITKGLSVLEYRGYDSVGLAARTELGVRTVKCKGRIDALRSRLEAEPIGTAHSAIGHTRWATHGGPSDRNAHPHRSGRVVLVHNGIIENYDLLRTKLSAEGIAFLSETDTEVAAAVLARAYDETNEPVAAIRRAMRRLQGSYAFAILFDDRKDEIYAVRSGSPLLLARGSDGFYLASDLTALLPFTSEYDCLAEGEIACLTQAGVAVYRENERASEPMWRVTQMTAEAAERGGYPHFMLKEIFEQPEALRNVISPRIRAGMPDFSSDGLTDAFLKAIRRIRIVACGSAMHAGLHGVHLFETLSGIPTSVSIASEYRYHPPIEKPDTLVILISQSGETADTLAALRYAKGMGLPTLAIVNALETTIAREADHRVYTYAGPEIAVATTKGYATQVAALYLLALAIARAQGSLHEDRLVTLAKTLFEEVPLAMRVMLGKRGELRRLAERICKARHVFYIGRGSDYAMAEEGALKLKEISYIHAEAYAAGELKHGTISLIEKGTPVVAISTDPGLYEKTESNLREVRSRGAYVILLCREDAKVAEESADTVIRLPEWSSASSLFACMIALQLLSYETAALLGCDIDRPRNLAKSVTVE